MRKEENVFTTSAVTRHGKTAARNDVYQGTVAPMPSEAAADRWQKLYGMKDEDRAEFMIAYREGVKETVAERDQDAYEDGLAEGLRDGRRAVTSIGRRLEI